jgi:hypothetical protein
MCQAANPNWWENGTILYSFCLCISSEYLQIISVNTINEVICQKTMNIYLEFGQILCYELP